MLYQGVLVKMKTEMASPVNYFLQLGADHIHVNQLLNKTLKVKRLGQQCLSCCQQKEIFRQGFCKRCFFDIPQAAEWVMRPELSRAHLNQEDRDLAYEKAAQLQPHIVYLANSSNVKVGVTRKAQVPTRWIDQGAVEALEIVEVPNRYLAGVTEVALKQYVQDKTNWREMLKGVRPQENLESWRNKLKPYLPEETMPYFLSNKAPLKIKFPVLKHPDKPRSINLAKTPAFQLKLVGVKGQYFLFDDGSVFNIRSHEGTVIGLDVLN